MAARASGHQSGRSASNVAADASTESSLNWSSSTPARDVSLDEEARGGALRGQGGDDVAGRAVGEALAGPDTGAGASRTGIPGPSGLTGM